VVVQAGQPVGRRHLLHAPVEDGVRHRQARLVHDQLEHLELVVRERVAGERAEEKCAHRLAGLHVEHREDQRCTQRPPGRAAARGAASSPCGCGSGRRSGRRGCAAPSRRACRLSAHLSGEPPRSIPAAVVTVKRSASLAVSTIAKSNWAIVRAAARCVPRAPRARASPAGSCSLDELLEAILELLVPLPSSPPCSSSPIVAAIPERISALVRLQRSASR